MKNRQKTQTEFRVRERRRRAFARRAYRAKGRWFGQAFRKEQKRILPTGCGVRRVFCLTLLLLGLWIFLATGKWENYEEETCTEETVLPPGERGMEHQEPGGWEKEIFGIRIHFRRGQISFFREKEQALPEKEEIH